jgi:hypothetical protein
VYCSSKASCSCCVTITQIVLMLRSGKDILVSSEEAQHVVAAYGRGPLPESKTGNMVPMASSFSES